MKYLAQLCGRFYAFLKISDANLRILWRHLPMALRIVWCVAKHIWSSNKQRKDRPNRCIIGDATSKLVRNWPKNTVLNLAVCCGAIWRHREKPQYSCTTTIHPVYNYSKKILKNLLPVWIGYQGCAHICAHKRCFPLLLPVLLYFFERNKWRWRWRWRSSADADKPAQRV